MQPRQPLVSESRRRRAALLAICLLAAALVGGCTRSQSTIQSKIQQVRIGMTVEEVEQLLGEPLGKGPVHPGDPEQPPDIASLPADAAATWEWREYQGDGKAKILIWFDDGVAIAIQEVKPRNRLPVG